MVRKDLAYYRMKAEECREHAEQVTSPLDRARWLELAAEWIRLAEDAERREN
jgi:hypothetical protein